MKKLYTQEEVDQLIIQSIINERKRAKDIAYELKAKHFKAFEEKKASGNDLAFVSEKISDECRIIGNIISGGNALSASLNESMEDRIMREYFKNLLM